MGWRRSAEALIRYNLAESSRSLSLTDAAVDPFA
jgi:hypothetical protein